MKNDSCFLFSHGKKGREKASHNKFPIGGFFFCVRKLEAALHFQAIIAILLL